MGVPRPALGWGACDPNNPKNRRRRTSLLVERARSGRRDPGAGRHLARPARATAGRRRRMARRRADDPRARRPHPRHRRSAGAVRQQAPPASTSTSTSRPRRSVRARFGYCFATPPGSEYPPIADRAPHGARAAAVTIDGEGRPDRRPAHPAAARRYRLAGLPVRRLCLFLRPERPAAESAAALAGLDVWVVDALRYKPHPSHFSLADALGWIERSSPSARS